MCKAPELKNKTKQNRNIKNKFFNKSNLLRQKSSLYWDQWASNIYL